MIIYQEAMPGFYDKAMCGGNNDYSYDPDSNCFENNQ